MNIERGRWYPYADLPPELPGYLLVRDRTDGWDNRPIPKGVPIVISWEPYPNEKGGGYQFTERWIFDGYSFSSFTFIEFMWLP